VWTCNGTQQCSEKHPVWKIALRETQTLPTRPLQTGPITIHCATKLSVQCKYVGHIKFNLHFSYILYLVPCNATDILIIIIIIMTIIIMCVRQQLLSEFKHYYDFFGFITPTIFHHKHTKRLVAAGTQTAGVWTEQCTVTHAAGTAMVSVLCQLLCHIN